MSIDLDSIASNFNCSVDDVKGLLENVFVQVSSFVEIIEFSVSSGDFSSIKIALDMIILEINHFGLIDMESAISLLGSFCDSEDIDGVNSSFLFFKSSLLDLNSVL